MHDDKLRRELRRSVDENGMHRSDVGWVLERGQELRRRRSLVIGAVGVAFAVLAGIAVTALSRPDGDRLPLQGDRDATKDALRGEVVEDVSERFRAEIFAFRALAATDLMGPFLKRSYNWTYEDDTSETAEGWKVGFAASDCLPRGGVFTCRGLSGEDPKLGNALTDTYVVVVLVDGQWEVLDVEGNMLDSDRTRIVGFSLPDRHEPSHWDFAAVDVWKDQHETFSMIPIWVGPYPTTAPGSLCQTTFVDENGKRVGTPTTFYQEPPSRPFERGGWHRGGGIVPDEPFVDAEVRCRQYRGQGWEITDGPRLVGPVGEVSGVSAELIWRGGKGFTSAFVCRTTLLDADGKVVFKGSGRLEPLWRPSELRDYPYEATIIVPTRGRSSVDAHSVGDFGCEDL